MVVGVGANDLDKVWRQQRDKAIVGEELLPLQPYVDGGRGHRRGEERR